jgi:hypothetical protein
MLVNKHSIIGTRHHAQSSGVKFGGRFYGYTNTHLVIPVINNDWLISPFVLLIMVNLIYGIE